MVLNIRLQNIEKIIKHVIDFQTNFDITKIKTSKIVLHRCKNCFHQYESFAQGGAAEITTKTSSPKGDPENGDKEV